MTMPNINLIPNEFSLADLLINSQKQLKLEFNCHHIGTIQSFNPLNQTAQVTINYTKSFLQISDVGNTSTLTPSYPTLLECPCIVLGGGGGYLSFPIASGDECLVLFNDRDLDNWFMGSSSSPPNTGRLHAFTDAVCLVGLRSMPNVLIDYQGSAVTLQYEGNTIQIKSSSVLINLSPADVPFIAGTSLELDVTGKCKVTNETGELLSALQTLFTDIQTATTNTMFGPQPLIMPTFTTDLAVLTSFV